MTDINIDDIVYFNNQYNNRYNFIVGYPTLYQNCLEVTIFYLMTRFNQYNNFYKYIRRNIIYIKIALK
jgi:hypothetical protein